MADELNGNQLNDGGAPAVAENTEVKPVEHMIPKSRFDEVNGKLKALEAKVTQYEMERMTEAERMQAQAKAAQEAAAQAQAQLRQARADAAIARAAATQGINPALLGRLVDVEFDEAGQPVNVDAAVAAVVAAYPQLKPAPVQLATTNPGRAAAKLTMEDVQKMTPAEINARWGEVQAVMAGR